MRRNKQAISLITLVITIIVMIIIAGAIILSLADTNIFDKASEAVNKYNENQQQLMDGLEWLDWEPGKKPVPNDWKENVWEVTSDNVPIPKGFVKSPYKGEGTKNEGLVIYALTEEEINEGVRDITEIDIDYQTSLETRNQFVWIPVNDFKKDFVRTSYDEIYQIISNELGIEENHVFYELVLDEENKPYNDDTINTAKYVNSLEEAVKMYDSVKKYKGFYIARYEAGVTSVDEEYYATRVDPADESIKELSITMGKYPYNSVPWYRSKQTSKEPGAVLFSRALYPDDDTKNKTGVISTLTYGVQWDRTLNWMKELNPEMDLYDKTSYGVFEATETTKEDFNTNAKVSRYFLGYEKWNTNFNKESGDNMMVTTGGYKKAKIFNIYDMAGNLREWTMEGKGEYINTIERVLRGGDFSMYNNFSLTSRTAYDGEYNYSNYTGFRPALYIK